jgi:hypothetical protein
MGASAGQARAGVLTRQSHAVVLLGLEDVEQRVGEARLLFGLRWGQ